MLPGQVKIPKTLLELLGWSKALFWDLTRLWASCGVAWTPDISTFVRHELVELVGYLEDNQETKLACWLGLAEEYGGGDFAFLLPSKSGRPIVQSAVLECKQRQGVDERVNWVINPIDVNVNTSSLRQESWSTTLKMRNFVSVFAIIFCGKLSF